MTWTYVDPALDPKDAVRLNIGDTDESNPLFSDEEINYVLTGEDNPYAAGAQLADMAAARFAREVDKSSDGDSISSSQRFKHFKELAEQLRAEAVRTGAAAVGAPFIGGISYADKEEREADTDRIPTAVRTNVHGNPRSGHDWRHRQVDR